MHDIRVGLFSGHARFELIPDTALCMYVRVHHGLVLIQCRLNSGSSRAADNHGCRETQNRTVFPRWRMLPIKSNKGLAWFRFLCASLHASFSIPVRHECFRVSEHLEMWPSEKLELIQDN